MRKILFKAKRTDNGEWIEGDLAKNFNGGLMIQPKPFFSSVIFTDDKETKWDATKDGLCIGGWFEVIPITVCQFTGLTDKNGKKIFEGDHDNDGNTVTWCEKQNGWTFSISHNFKEIIACHCYYCEGNFSFDELIDDFEKTGNIHDKKSEQ